MLNTLFETTLAVALRAMTSLQPSSTDLKITENDLKHLYSDWCYVGIDLEKNCLSDFLMDQKIQSLMALVLSKF